MLPYFNAFMFECECEQEKYIILWGLFDDILNSSETIGKAEACRQSEAIVRAGDTNNAEARSVLTLLYN
jgi:hypothetical protein